MDEMDIESYKLFDENIGALKNNMSSTDKAEYYYNSLKTRIEGEASVSKVRYEVYNFIYVNTLMPGDMKKKLVEMVDDTSYVDGNKLSSDILSYLRENYLASKIEYEMSEEKVDEMKTDFTTEVETRLNDSNVLVSGDINDLKDELKTEDDLYKLKDEVEAVQDTLKDNKDNEYNLTVNDLTEAVNSTKDDVLLDKINDQVEEKNKFEVTDDGSIEIDGSLLDNNDQNYVTMMIAGLTASDLNLDMYLSKDKKNNNDYKVTFGNLPVKNHPENKLSTETITKINEISDKYDNTINYQEVLDNINPTIGTLNDIMFDEMNEDGTMKVGINNHDGMYVIGINMSSEHQNLADAFSTNGASVSTDLEENSVVKIDGDQLEQYSVLSNTKSTLDKEKDNSDQLTNTYQYVKKIDSEAANVSPSFLLTVAAAEVLLILSYAVLYIINK